MELVGGARHGGKTIRMLAAISSMRGLIIIPAIDAKHARLLRSALEEMGERPIVRAKIQEFARKEPFTSRRSIWLELCK